MRIHFIAIGGSVMHNLAISLARLGHQVTGSDDQIVEPSKSNLREAGLYPTEIGWNADVITEDLDAIILGSMQTRIIQN
jgi:UDP-N-acetylmuramate: L-alanyl-gamma-D-glutamyl-meso-diaminopimelate ligase